MINTLEFLFTDETEQPTEEIPSREELLELITKSGKVKARSKIKLTIYEKFLRFYVSQHKGTNLCELFYWFKHNMTSFPFCKTCDKEMVDIPFRNTFLGYDKNYCNKSCLSKNPERIEQVKQTKLEKYGNEFYVNVDINNLKEQATKELGYNFKFMIY